MRSVVAVVVVLAQLAPGNQVAFRSSADAVEVRAQVRDKHGPVGGLGLGDFTVADNGVVYQVSDVTRERLPLSISLAVDASASMVGRESVLNALEAALRAHVRGRDVFRILEFGSEVRERSPNTRTLQALGSAVRDALLLVLAGQPLSEHRQIAILASDGQDNLSYFGEDLVIRAARQSPVAVFSVLVGSERSKMLERVTSETGGVMLRAESFEQLSDRVGVAIDQARSAYVIRYQTQGHLEPGWHHVELAVPGRAVEIVYKKGYWLR
jgi:hypothetical protein